MYNKRLLNGALTAVAYPGILEGYQYVHEVMRDDHVVRYLRHMMQREILPTLQAKEGLDEYIEQILSGFSHPAMHHSLYPIAMDGSEKLPTGLLGSIVEGLEQKQDIECLCFALAAWLRYTMAFDQKGDPLEVQDPLADVLLAIRKTHWDHIDKLIDAYLSLARVFGSELKQSGLFRQRLTYWLSCMLSNGVATARRILLLEVEDSPVCQNEVLPC